MVAVWKPLHYTGEQDSNQQTFFPRSSHSIKQHLPESIGNNSPDHQSNPTWASIKSIKSIIVRTQTFPAPGTRHLRHLTVVSCRVASNSIQFSSREITGAKLCLPLRIQSASPFSLSRSGTVTDRAQTLSASFFLGRGSRHFSYLFFFMTIFLLFSSFRVILVPWLASGQDKV